MGIPLPEVVADGFGLSPPRYQLFKIRRHSPSSPRAAKPKTQPFGPIGKAVLLAALAVLWSSCLCKITRPVIEFEVLLFEGRVDYLDFDTSI
jgi:hypothetical protein